MRYLLLICMIPLLGCASVTRYNDTSYTPKSENAEIEVFRTNEPSKPYIELGEIKARYMSGVKSEARQLGADAVIIIGSARKGYSGYNSESGLSFGSSKDRGFHAIAIKYK